MYFSPYQLQILFATLDPLDPPSQNVPGHFCVVAVNLHYSRFELLDSLRGRDDPDGKGYCIQWQPISKSYGGKLQTQKEIRFFPTLLTVGSTTA